MSSLGRQQIYQQRPQMEQAERVTAGSRPIQSAVDRRRRLLLC